MDAGDTLTVLSGADGETITEFTIPDVPANQKVKAIRGMNQKVYRADWGVCECRYEQPSHGHD